MPTGRVTFALRDRQRREFLGPALLLAQTSDRGVGIVGCLGAIGTGTIAGFMLDRVLRGWCFSRRIQFRMVDCLVATLVVALLIAFRSTFARVAKF